MKILKEINKEELREFLYRQMDINDDLLYEEMNSGNSIGIFQMNGGTAERIISEVHPENFNELNACNALSRPGPIENAQLYVDGKNGSRSQYPKQMQDILKDTYFVCLYQEEEVFTSSGIKKIKDIEIGQKVFSYNEKGLLEEDEVIFKKNNGIKKYLEVTLNNGEKVRATHDHLFYTVMGWKKLEEIISLDLDFVYYNFNFNNNVSNRKNELKFLGYIIGDGDISNLSAVNFVNKNEYILEDFKNTIEKIWGSSIKYKEIEQIREVKRVCLSGTKREGSYMQNPALIFLREVGLKFEKNGCNSHNKFIPEVVFNSSYEDICFFLSALYDTDGTSTKESIRYKTASERLAYDLSKLLRFNGFPSNVHSYDGYYDIIIQGKNINKFIDDVISKTVSKKFICEKQTYEKNRTCKVKYFIKDGEYHKPMHSIKKACNFSDTRSLYYFKNGNKRITKGNFDLIYENYYGENNFKDFYYAHIKNVEEKEGLVYDIEINKNKNFIYNGIITHNCLYQEQIMEIFHKIGGFSLEAADQVRGLMKKLGKLDKDPEDVKLWNKTVKKFTKGAVNNGIPEAEAERIANDLVSFAGYSFNNSHSTSYTYIAVITLYLSVYFRKYFYSSVLTYEIERDKKVLEILQSIKQNDFKILPPDINKSDYHISPLKENAIIFGLQDIKYVGENAVRKIIENRPYESLFDFVMKTRSREVSSRVIDSLIKAGAFDKLINKERKRAIQTFGQFWQHKGTTKIREKLENLWNKIETHNEKLPYFETTTQTIREYEKDIFGFIFFTSLFSEEKINMFKEMNKRGLIKYSFDDVSSASRKVPVELESVRVIKDKNGNEMAFVSISDIKGNKASIPVFASYWKYIKTYFLNDHLYLFNLYRDDRGSILFGKKEYTISEHQILKMVKQIP